MFNKKLLLSLVLVNFEVVSSRFDGRDFKDLLIRALNVAVEDCVKKADLKSIDPVLYEKVQAFESCRDRERKESELRRPDEKPKRSYCVIDLGFNYSLLGYDRKKEHCRRLVASRLEKLLKD